MEYLEWLKLRFRGAKHMTLYKRGTNMRRRINDARRGLSVSEHCQSL